MPYHNKLNKNTPRKKFMEAIPIFILGALASNLAGKALSTHSWFFVLAPVWLPLLLIFVLAAIGIALVLAAYAWDRISPKKPVEERGAKEITMS